MFSHIVYVSVTCLVLAYQGWIPPENPPGVEITPSFNVTEATSDMFDCPKTLLTTDLQSHDLRKTSPYCRTTDENYTQILLKTQHGFSLIKTSTLKALPRDKFIHKPRQLIVVDRSTFMTPSTRTDRPTVIYRRTNVSKYPKIKLNSIRVGKIRPSLNIGQTTSMLNTSLHKYVPKEVCQDSADRVNGYRQGYGITATLDKFKHILINGYEMTINVYQVGKDRLFSGTSFFVLTDFLHDSLTIDNGRNQTDTTKESIVCRDIHLSTYQQNHNKLDPDHLDSNAGHIDDDVTQSFAWIQFGLGATVLFSIKCLEFCKCRRYSKRPRLKHRNGKYLELGLSRYFRYLQVQPLTNGPTTSYNRKIRSDILTAKLDIQRKNMRRNNQVISLFGINNSNVMSATSGRHPFSFLGKYMPVQNKIPVKEDAYSNDQKNLKDEENKSNTLFNYGCYPLISPWVTLMKSAPGTDDFSTDGKRHNNGLNKPMNIPFLDVTRPGLPFRNFNTFARQLIKLSEDLTYMGSNTAVYEKCSLLTTAYILQRVGRENTSLETEV